METPTDTKPDAGPPTLTPFEGLTPLEIAAKIVGSQTVLANLLGVSKGAIPQWKGEGQRVPAEHCPVIERVTGGAVRCEDLRPDIEWGVLRKNRAPLKKAG
jgi:DNA-binding transcriptional regulator YdaS (Cro superfamily)